MPQQQHQSHYRVRSGDESQAREVDRQTVVAKVEKATNKYEGPRFPNLHMLFKQKDGAVVDRAVETINQRDDSVVEKTSTYQYQEENIDIEAGEYIKRRREKYSLQKLNAA